MTFPRKPGFVLPVAVTVAVLLGAYVGAYYAMVTPVPGRPAAAPFYGEVDMDESPEKNIRRLMAYQDFFAPIHWLDRRIRPHVWEPTP